MASSGFEWLQPERALLSIQGARYTNYAYVQYILVNDKQYFIFLFSVWLVNIWFLVDSSQCIELLSIYDWPVPYKISYSIPN